MVQLMNSGMKKSPRTKRLKTEVDDSVEDLLGQFHTRSKLELSSEKRTSEASAFSVPPYLYNPLEEPSPLGLNLRKSPSLLDLIQAKLSQETASKFAALGKKDQKGTNIFNAVDKLKASNFPASILKIGSWEYKSRYEGDLVAKCYFAKHKLVWELLDGNLKNKIEIQWSDIVALKATSAEDGVGNLDVVLARQPLFFREINPQPKKHTLWQATADFTGGEASRHRRHFLQCSQGLLNKHFDKLIRCDPRLNFLSQQPDIVLEFPYFKTNSSLAESKEGFGLKSEEGPTLFSLGLASPSATQSPSSNKEHDGFTGASDEYPEQSPSPNSVMETHVNEEIRIEGSENARLFNKWDQIVVPGIRPSMSVSDFVSYIGHCLSQQMTSNGPIFSEENQQSSDALEEITQYLFGDSQLTSDSDEQTLMSRVNSLCCLLQKDPSMAKTSRPDHGNTDSISALECGIKNQEGFPLHNGHELNKSSGSKHIDMARNDSVGELLLNLPRIASLPQFLFNLLEDSDDRAR